MRKLLLLILVTLFISCNFFNKSEDNKPHISAEEEKLKTEQEEIAELKENISNRKKYIKELDSLNNLYENLILNSDKNLVYNYFNTRLISSYEEDFNISFNRVQLQEKHLNIPSFINELENHFTLSKENDILRSLTNNWSQWSEELKITIPYFFTEEVRSTNYLKSLFTKTVINGIEASLIKTGVYENSKLNEYVEVLLTAYNNFGADDYSKLEELYDLATIGYFKEQYEINNILDDINYLDIGIYDSVFDNYVSGMDDGTFNVYSFWARRQHEGNMETVYWLMNTIHSRFIGNNSNEELVDTMLSELEQANNIDIPIFSRNIDDVENKEDLSSFLSELNDVYHSKEEFSVTYWVNIDNFMTNIKREKSKVYYQKIMNDSLVYNKDESQYLTTYINQFSFDDEYALQHELPSLLYGETLVNKLAHKLERSPSNINNILSSNNLSIIVSLIPKEDFIAYGFQDFLDALLISYEELDEDMLNNIIAVSNLNYYNYDQFHPDSEFENKEFKMNFMNKIASDRVKNKLKKIAPYQNGDFKDFWIVESNERFSLFSSVNVSLLYYIYTFWGRRHTEGNKDVVYNILKEFNFKMNAE